MKENVLDGLGNLLKIAEKLAVAQGNEEAQENVKKMKEALGEEEREQGKKSVEGSDLGGLLSKLLDFVGNTNVDGKEFQQRFAGGKGMFSGGIRVLGKSFGSGSLPPEGRRQTEEGEFKPVFKKPSFSPKKKIAEPKNESCGEELILELSDEGDFIRIIGDMPGVEEKDIRCHVNGKTLKVYTEGKRKYKTEIELPASVKQKQEPTLKYKNGILEITLKTS